jgi:hypothetical protein
MPSTPYAPTTFTLFPSTVLTQRRRRAIRRRRIALAVALAGSTTTQGS